MSATPLIPSRESLLSRRGLFARGGEAMAVSVSSSGAIAGRFMVGSSDDMTEGGMSRREWVDTEIWWGGKFSLRGGDGG